MRAFLKGFASFSNWLLILFILAAWYFFAPVNLGGRVSYVVVDGNSMEPLFHSGDLVIVAKANSYKTGDIVTYFDPKMNGYIVHRIIGVEDGRFVMKGDNNSWIDSTKPTLSEIIGKEWIFLPKFGSLLMKFKEPIFFTLLAVVLVAMIFFTFLRKPLKKKGSSPSVPGGSVSTLAVFFYLFGFLAFFSLAGGIYFFMQPLMKTAPGTPYTQNGTFAYSANAISDIYDAGKISSGEPVFTNLNCFVKVDFTYSLAGNALQEISGEQALSVTISDTQSGWTRSVPLTDEIPIHSSSFTNSAYLNICTYRSLITNLHAQAGLAQNTYALDVLSQVNIRGKLNGQPFTDSFDQKLTFNLDKVHLFVRTTAAQKDPFQLTVKRVLQNPNQVENTFSLLKWTLTISEMRFLALSALGVAVVGLLVLFAYYYYLSNHQPAAIIQMKYGSMIVDASHIEGSHKVSLVISVKNMDELSKIAARQNSNIIHITRENTHYYLVEQAGTIYHYMLPDENLKTNEINVVQPKKLT